MKQETKQKLGLAGIVLGTLSVVYSCDVPYFAEKLGMLKEGVGIACLGRYLLNKSRRKSKK